ncbi:hypothetical protein KM043_009714 [Ampulex compressa]|nr:hypothetical protein KM043_009714 [Ampulex compressa]
MKCGDPGDVLPAEFRDGGEVETPWNRGFEERGGHRWIEGGSECRRDAKLKESKKLREKPIGLCSNHPGANTLINISVHDSHVFRETFTLDKKRPVTYRFASNSKNVVGLRITNTRKHEAVTCDDVNGVREEGWNRLRGIRIGCKGVNPRGAANIDRESGDMYRVGSWSLDDLDSASMKHPSRSPGLEVAMALFGMVWLLRVRSEMRRCTKCRHEEMLAAQQHQQQLQQHQQHHHHHHHQHHQRRTLSQPTSLLQTPDDAVSSSANTLFTLDTPGAAGPAGSYCEVHGYVQAKEDIQEFYELTLLDESKTVQQKTAETIRIADKWEASDGPITPTFAQNDGGPASAVPLTQTLLNIYGRRSASPDAPDAIDETQKTRYAGGGGPEEQLPPPPSPPQLKEGSQLDGVPRPNSVERILHPDGAQHILASHEALNKRAEFRSGASQRRLSSAGRRWRYHWASGNEALCIIPPLAAATRGQNSPVPASRLVGTKSDANGRKLGRRFDGEIFRAVRAVIGLTVARRKVTGIRSRVEHGRPRGRAVLGSV